MKTKLMQSVTYNIINDWSNKTYRISHIVKQIYWDLYDGKRPPEGDPIKEYWEYIKQAFIASPKYQPFMEFIVMVEPSIVSHIQTYSRFRASNIVRTVRSYVPYITDDIVDLVMLIIKIHTGAFSDAMYKYESQDLCSSVRELLTKPDNGKIVLNSQDIEVAEILLSLKKIN